MPSQEDVQSATCCDICMEADVEVMSTCHPVKHGMCIECARAVCSMKVRCWLAPPAHVISSDSSLSAGPCAPVPLLPAGHHLLRACAGCAQRLSTCLRGTVCPESSSAAVCTDFDWPGLWPHS